MVSIWILVTMTIVACGGDEAEPSATTAPGVEITGDPGSDVTTAATATTGGSASLGDPCDYVDDSQMSEILEMSVAGESAGSVITCDYLPTESDDLLAGGVNVVIEDVSDGGCEPVFDVAGFGSTGGEPVDGVGTYARYSEDFVQQLAVCFDDDVTLIATLGMESADPLGTLVSVAQAVGANLP